MNKLRYHFPAFSVVRKAYLLFIVDSNQKMQKVNDMEKLICIQVVSKICLS